MSLKNLTLIGRYTLDNPANALIALNSPSGAGDIHHITIDSCYVEQLSTDVAIIDTVQNAEQTTIQIRDSFLNHGTSAIRVTQPTGKAQPIKNKDIKVEGSTFYSQQPDTTGTYGHIQVNSSNSSEITNIMISGNTFWSPNTTGTVAIMYNTGTSSVFTRVNAATSNISNRSGGVLGGSYSPIQVPLLTNVGIQEPDEYNI